MSILGQCGAKRCQDVDLSRGVVDVVIAPDDVRDFHVPVVHNNTEIVGWGSVRPRNDQVVKFGVINTDRPFDQIIPCGGTIQRIPEAYYWLAPLWDSRQCFS